MGGSGSKSSGRQAPNILPFIKQFAAETSPLRSLALGQFEESLRTGGTGAQIPSIQRAVEQSNQAASNALRDTRGGLQAAGLDGTPFGQRTLADIGLQGRQASSQVGPAFALNQAQSAPQLVTAIIGQLLGGLSSEGVTKSRSGGGGI